MARTISGAARRRSMLGFKAGIDLGIPGLGGSLSGRGGLYMTFGADGSQQDMGIRTTGSESLTVGTTTYAPPPASFQWSFVSGFSAPGL
jgi:hypothetical protein